ncbi:MAG TPA: 3-hydroxyacyl-CoA dehydrogenase NAD-binding domain-containing protein [Candidatus Limnocylindrales bacterium]|nr:3-hydroxyacyl-CoA dehydrogenase NAD-binding domain-containing protein [Candidatus Limnocylindrales bacterium]
MNEVTTVGVLGAGTMGAGIAQIAAEAGLEVLVHDPLAGATDRALERIGRFLARKVEKGQLTEAERAAAVGRLGTSAMLEGLGVAEIVIEAIPEDLELKRDAFRRLDGVAVASTILATNTSSLAIARIASATAHPGRVVGMHFFNPVPLMALVEVIPGPMTDPGVTDSVAYLARLLGKTPVVAADTPGFIVNRVQRAYYLEAFRMLEGGLADATAIDAAMRGIGFRLGPFELADVVGTDINLAAGISIFEGFFGDPRYRPAQVQRRVADAGRLGRKTSAGYYDYEADGTRGAAWPALVTRAGARPRLAHLDAAQIEARILAAIVNEAASAVADGVGSPEAIDTAMRLATNWPEGPLAWGERIGLTSVVHSLDALHATVPDGRYRVTPILRVLADGGGSFFQARA